VLIVTAWSGPEKALNLAGTRAFAGKLVIDATHPLRFTTRLELALGHSDSSGEQVKPWLPEARMVKAFKLLSR
jgi:predicted dinucleotide-binding enzyme